MVRPAATSIGEGLQAYCTCLDYKRDWPPDTEALAMASAASDHIHTHPNAPLSIVQVTTGDVIMVFNVPSMVDDEPIHMTVTVSDKVYDDNYALANHLGVIGSALHFEAERQRKHQGHEVRIPVQFVRANEIDFSTMPGFAPDGPGPTGLLDFLRQQHQAGEAAGQAFLQQFPFAFGGPGVDAFFEQKAVRDPEEPIPTTEQENQP